MPDSYTIIETCEICGIDESVINEFLQKEWLNPTEEEIFDEQDLARLRLILELQKDFQVNEPGIDLILHLLDQLNTLRRAMNKLN